MNGRDRANSAKGFAPAIVEWSFTRSIIIVGWDFTKLKLFLRKNMERVKRVAQMGQAGVSGGKRG